MITSAQRAKLRGIANTIEPILYIGKEGITENILKQADDALNAARSLRALYKKTVIGLPKKR